MKVSNNDIYWLGFGIAMLTTLNILVSGLALFAAVGMAPDEWTLVVPAVGGGMAVAIVAAFFTPAWHRIRPKQTPKER